LIKSCIRAQNFGINIEKYNPIHTTIFLVLTYNQNENFLQKDNHLIYMQIKEISDIQLDNLKHDYFIDIHPKKNLYPIVVLDKEFIILGDKNATFAISIEKKDFTTNLFWDFINYFYKLNIIKLAKWWNKNRLFENLENLFLVFGWSYNYKTKSEWEEWHKFQKNSEILIELYDFPVQTLRLWDRLPETIQSIWLEILNIFRIKKNYLKEIIQDLYDLSTEEQESLSLKALELAKKYQAEKMNLFPQEEIRELIKSVRYKLSYERKKESYKLKKKIEHSLQLKNLDINLPEDLESEPIELKIYLKNKNDLLLFLEKIQDSKSKQLMLELLDYVFEK
jgi:hypothetical protein